MGLLPVGLEFAENVSNVVQQIDGRKDGSNRFQGTDFFSECYKSMSPKDKVWYALIYCVWHELQGEYRFAYKVTINNERGEILALAKRLSSSDWEAIGVSVGVKGTLARERVMSIFL